MLLTNSFSIIQIISDLFLSNTHTHRYLCFVFLFNQTEMAICLQKQTLERLLKKQETKSKGPKVQDRECYS